MLAQFAGREIIQPKEKTMSKNPNNVRHWRKTPFAARRVGVREMGPDAIREKYALSIRSGKTEKDHKSGAWASRFSNRAARVEWQKDTRATNDTFPG